MHNKIKKKILERGYPLCIGIDPHNALIPQCFYSSQCNNSLGAHERFIHCVLDIAQKYTDIVKFQIGFFEQYGSDGIKILEKMMKKAREKNLIVILDAKRCDIPSTSESYSRAFFLPSSPLYCDILTVNPYFGFDALSVFARAAHSQNKSICITVTSSHTSGLEIQKSTYKYLTEKISYLTNKDKIWRNVLLVIGNSSQKHFPGIRHHFPDNLLLIPGIGFQGYSLHDHAHLIKTTKQKIPYIIPSASRSLLFANKKTMDDKEDINTWKTSFESRIRKFIQNIKETINQYKCES